MALFDDLNEGVRKVFLAGVGAVVVGAEKSQGLIEELVKRGELTVEQGKVLNEDLTSKVREATKNASEEILRSRLRSMTPEEREAWLARAKKISDDLEVEDAEFEVAEEDVPEPVEDEPVEVAEEEPAEEAAEETVE